LSSTQNLAYATAAAEEKMLCVNEEIVRADSFQNLGTKTGSPLKRLLADPLSETKKWRKFSRQKIYLSNKSARFIYVYGVASRR
jgi:hypothetical protein